jgi:hypothetical protein
MKSNHGAWILRRFKIIERNANILDQPRNKTSYLLSLHDVVLIDAQWDHLVDDRCKWPRRILDMRHSSAAWDSHVSTKFRIFLYMGDSILKMFSELFYKVLCHSIRGGQNIRSLDHRPAVLNNFIDKIMGMRGNEVETVSLGGKFGVLLTRHLILLYNVSSIIPLTLFFFTSLSKRQF